MTTKTPTSAKATPSFIDILEGPFKYLVEAIEWGCSDPQVITNLIAELYDKTGYRYHQTPAPAPAKRTRLVPVTDDRNLIETLDGGHVTIIQVRPCETWSNRD